jgi:hypothetical protein
MKHKSCRTAVGLTRQSILFARNRFAKMMDARVKPAHDGLERFLTWRQWDQARRRPTYSLFSILTRRR